MKVHGTPVTMETYIQTQNDEVESMIEVAASLWDTEPDPDPAKVNPEYFRAQVELISNSDSWSVYTVASSHGIRDTYLRRTDPDETKDAVAKAIVQQIKDNYNAHKAHR